MNSLKMQFSSKRFWEIVICILKMGQSFIYEKTFHSLYH